MNNKKSDPFEVAVSHSEISTSQDGAVQCTHAARNAVEMGMGSEGLEPTTSTV